MSRGMTQTDQAGTKPLGWKIYFWWMLVSYIVIIGLAVLPTVAHALTNVFEGDFIYIKHIIPSIIFGFFGSFGLIGLYNYVFDEKIMKAGFWKIFTSIFIIAFVLGTIITVANEHNLYESLYDIQAFVIFTPMCLALYRFTFKNPDLLQSDSA